jgi:hypothetical protein
MAATKAILSMRQWAFTQLGSSDELEFVVMASKDDLQANAEFIRLANAYVEVPAGKNTNNYANVKLIVDIAQKQSVDAVWPGWGHASENPELPRSLAEAGITFLGPTAPVMHALGDKIASTILAQSSGVPVIPWNGDGVTADIQADGSIPQEPFRKACLQSCDEALACAHKIGYPVVLKASEGGGGKGIRKCSNDAELRLGWDQVTTEVAGSPIFRCNCVLVHVIWKCNSLAMSMVMLLLSLDATAQLSADSRKYLRRALQLLQQKKISVRPRKLPNASQNLSGTGVLVPSSTCTSQTQNLSISWSSIRAFR